MYKKNVALLIGSLSARAGSERVVIDSANHLSSKGHNVYIFVCGNVEAKYEICERVTVLTLTEAIPECKLKQVLWYPIYIYKLNKLCVKYNIGLIISHWTKLSICLPLVKKNVIKWAHEHQNDKLLANWLKYIKQKTYTKIDYLTVLNQSERELSHGKYNQNVGIIPGYVSNEFRLTNHNKEKCQTLLFVGRLVDEKQPILLLNLLKKTNFMKNNWKLCMIGDGYLRPDVEKEISNYFDGRVTLLPSRSLLDYYRQCESILITSKTEGFGLTIVEAMSQRCIPISFDCDFGPRNIIEDGVDGFLCNGEDEFINKVNYLFQAPLDELDDIRNKALIKSSLYSQNKILELWHTSLNGLFDEL